MPAEGVCQSQDRGILRVDVLSVITGTIGVTRDENSENFRKEVAQSKYITK